MKIRKEDFADTGERYDLIFHAVGKRKAKLQCEKALTLDGKHITVDDGRPKLRIKDLILLKVLVEAGEIQPVIDRHYLGMFDPQERLPEEMAAREIDPQLSKQVFERMLRQITVRAVPPISLSARLDTLCFSRYDSNHYSNHYKDGEE